MKTLKKKLMRARAQLKAWALRLLFNRQLVGITTEIEPRLFDTILIAGKDKPTQMIYVGGGKYLLTSKKKRYPTIKISGNFNLHEILL